MKSKYNFTSAIRNLIPSIQNSTTPTLAQLKNNFALIILRYIEEKIKMIG